MNKSENIDELIRSALNTAAENSEMTVEQKNELLLKVLTKYLKSQIGSDEK